MFIDFFSALFHSSRDRKTRELIAYMSKTRIANNKEATAGFMNYFANKSEEVGDYKTEKLARQLRDQLRGK